MTEKQQLGLQLPLAVIIHRPKTGIKEYLREELKQKYRSVDEEEARGFWQREIQHNAHEKSKQHFLLQGDVLHAWGQSNVKIFIHI